MDSSNDDYKNDDVDTKAVTDEYHVITNTIKKSFDAYSNYNERVKQLSEKNNNVEPDYINKTILDSKFDNW
jgi:galactokinase